MGAALLVAHPGHELCVHGWLEREAPLVLVLTDGSGSRGEARVESTRRVVAAAGARPGPVFGRLPDRRVYEALLEGKRAVFGSLLDEMAEAVQASGARVLAADAAEGFNPAHDVARLLADAVARRLARSGNPVESLSFPLDAAPGTGSGAVAVRLELDDAALARKLAAARGYPEMAGEVASALARHGEGAFRVEELRRSEGAFDLAAAHGPVPRYERFGEERRERGVYREVLRFRDHVEPLARYLEALASGERVS